MPDPMYRRIADDLRDKIESGALPHGSQLPTEIELRERYDASRNTVRDAMKWLITRGLVETRPGQGTFVVDKIVPFVTQLTGDPGTGRDDEGPVYVAEVEANSARADLHRAEGGNPAGGRRRPEPAQASGQLHGGQQAPAAPHRRHPLVAADLVLPDGPGRARSDQAHPGDNIDEGAVAYLGPGSGSARSATATRSRSGPGQQRDRLLRTPRRRPGRGVRGAAGGLRRPRPALPARRSASTRPTATSSPSMPVRFPMRRFPTMVRGTGTQKRPHRSPTRASRRMRRSASLPGGDTGRQLLDYEDSLARLNGRGHGEARRRAAGPGPRTTRAERRRCMAKYHAPFGAVPLRALRSPLTGPDTAPESTRLIRASAPDEIAEPRHRPFRAGVPETERCV